MRYSINDKEKKIIATVENLDDIWTINNIVQIGDCVAGKSIRRFRIDDSSDSDKKTIWVKLKLEKKEFDVDNTRLRFTGIIEEGSPSEYVDIGSYHSLDIMPGSMITVFKDAFLGFERDFLESAKKFSLSPKIIAIVLDDEAGHICELNYNNYKILGKIISANKGKRYSTKENKNYYSDIFEVIKGLDGELFVISGPGFEKEKLFNFLKEKSFKGKSLLVSLNSTGVTGIVELMRSPSLVKILENFKIAKDLEKINTLMSAISNDKKNVIYGKNQITDIFDSQITGVKEIIVSTVCFNNNYNSLKSTFIKLSKQKSKIQIIDSNNEAGKILDGMGGIILLLHYSLK